MRHRVYVPADFMAKIHSIREGSGIVGRMDGQRLLIDYEGAIYGQDMRYAEKVLHAAGRQSVMYPTIARLWVAPESMIGIGWYDDALGIVCLDDLAAAERLAAWLGVSNIADLPRDCFKARGARWRR